jgi:Pathogenicity locus
MDREHVTDLEDLPNIGPAIAGKLRLIGVNEPSDLVGRDPDELYEKLGARLGLRPDPCVLDVFVAATRFMAGEPARPWWEYSRERKNKLTSNR